MTKTILLTGATGFIGSHLLEAMSRRADWRVVPTTRLESPLGDGLKLELEETSKICAALRELKPDHVIHAAGRVRASPAQLYQDNVVTTVAIADAVATAAPNAILTVLGSAAEYGLPGSAAPIPENYVGEPVSVYGHAKHAAARYLNFCAGRGLSRNLVRVFNPVAAKNPGSLVVGAFIERAVRAIAAPPPRRAEMGYLGSVRDFLAMSDLVRLIEQIVERDKADVVVNACSGRALRVRDVLDEINRCAGGGIEIIEGANPLSNVHDAVVGDPTLFLRVAEISEPTPIEKVLEEAWEAACGALLAGGGAPSPERQNSKM